LNDKGIGSSAGSFPVSGFDREYHFSNLTQATDWKLLRRSMVQKSADECIDLISSP